MSVRTRVQGGVIVAVGERVHCHRRTATSLAHISHKFTTEIENDNYFLFLLSQPCIDWQFRR
jgi:hypothetical protein